MGEPKTRTSRKWWYVGESDVREVIGYDCKPHNPDTWWCPEVGVSATEGYHLFATKGDAIEKALSELREKSLKIQGAIDRLNAQR